MLQLRCPICDAPVETHTSDRGETIRCSRCGHSFAAAVGPAARPDLQESLEADQWTVHVPAFPGRRVIRLVQQLAKRPSFLAGPGRAHDVGRQALACPKCDRLVKQRSSRWLSKSDWRSIGIALIVVVGVPAALIFFLVVVCAPRGH